MGTDHDLAEFNYVHDCDGAGIQAYLLRTNITVRFNVLIGNGANSASTGQVYVANSSSTALGIDIYNNTLISTADSVPGIVLGQQTQLLGSPTNIWANNIIITTNAPAIWSYATTATNVGLYGNDYYDLDGTVNFIWNGTAYASWGAFTNAYKQDLVGFTNNPSLKSLAIVTNNNANTIQSISNYRLKGGSPLVGAGQNLNSIFGITMPTTDFSGSALPALGYSVGAYNLTNGIYYVDTTNSAASDSNIGSQSAPWKTISKGTTTVSSGDELVVGAGTYTENVVPPSGTTVAGVRSSSGDWLTIIDSGTLVTNGWVAAPEIGSGVWKITNSFNVSEMTLNRQRVAFVWTLGPMTNDALNAYTNAVILNLTAGSNFLAMATNLTLYTTQDGNALNSWDAMEALWGYILDGTKYTVYFRKRDGGTPDGLNIRLYSSAKAFDMGGKNSVVASNLFLYANEYGFGLDGATSYNDVIVSNYIYGGHRQVNMESGAHDNIVKNNTLTNSFYGYADPGAWDYANSPVPYGYIERGNLYVVSKFLMGDSTTRYEGVRCYLTGVSNTVCGNTISSGLGVGIELQSATNNLIYSNRMERMPSVGLTLGEGQNTNYVYDNSFSDNNINIRFTRLNLDANRLAYIYRNTFYLPDGTGDHTFTHSYTEDPTNVNQAQVWIYQNSFSGGVGGLRDNGEAKNHNSLTNFHWLNNIFSDQLYIDPNSEGWQLWTNATAVGSFDYNVIVNPPPFDPSFSTHASPAWFGSHNLTNSANVWANAAGMNFRLPGSCVGINAGLDIPTTYPTLPQDSTVMKGTAWDIGALEYVPPQATANTLHAGTLRSPP